MSNEPSRTDDLCRERTFVPAYETTSTYSHCPRCGERLLSATNCIACTWPAEQASNAKVTATDGSVEYLHYNTPIERCAIALEAIAEAHKTNEDLLRIGERIAAALENEATMTRREMLDLIVAQQDRIGAAYEAVGPDKDVTADLDENIQRLRAERDELREKVERYERMTTVRRDGKIINEYRTS